MKKGYVNFWFWLSFSVSILLCGLMLFFAGFLTAKSQEVRLRESLNKKSVKIDNLLLRQKLDKKLDFLNQEIQKIKEQNGIPSVSPLLALVVFHQSQVEKVYTGKDDLDFLQKEDPPLPLEKKADFLNRTPLTPPAGKKKEQTPAKNALVELSQKLLAETSSGDFDFIYAKEKSPLAVFVQSAGPKQKQVAFLKMDKNFFQLALGFPKEREAFVVNRQGRILFHSQPDQVFKRLSKNSPLLTSFGRPFKKDSPGRRYLKSTKTKGPHEIYYFWKWNQGDLFLVSRTSYSLPPFLEGDFYEIVWLVVFIAFALFFSFFCLKTLSLSSSYKFLKMAFLSFAKTGLFPPVSSKNPLLYFYNNRWPFLNRKQTEDQESREIKSPALNFTEVVRQELGKLKSRFPLLSVTEEYNFDIKVFGFEKFLRALVRELLLNALEAMGGLKEPKLNISLKEEGESLVFFVRDYGKGVPTKDYKKIFRMYYSSKSQLGVGLNVVQSIVQANEGELDLASPKEGGLKISIRLPLKCFLKNHSHPLGAK